MGHFFVFVFETSLFVPLSSIQAGERHSLCDTSVISRGTTVPMLKAKQ